MPAAGTRFRKFSWSIFTKTDPAEPLTNPSRKSEVTSNPLPKACAASKAVCCTACKLFDATRVVRVTNPSDFFADIFYFFSSKVEGHHLPPIVSNSRGSVGARGGSRTISPPSSRPFFSRSKFPLLFLYCFFLQNRSWFMKPFLSFNVAGISI